MLFAMHSASWRVQTFPAASPALAEAIARRGMDPRGRTGPGDK